MIMPPSGFADLLLQFRLPEKRLARKLLGVETLLYWGKKEQPSNLGVQKSPQKPRFFR
jgi:hypothetical protein